MTYEVLDSLVLTSRLPSTDARQLLAARIARRFSRFAYPDELHPLLKPLRDEVRSKVAKEQSAVGRVMGRVETLRINMVGGWDAEPPWKLQLLVVVRPEFLPFMDRVDDAPLDLGDLTAGPRALTKVAEDLLVATPSTAASLWMEFGAALVQHMESKANMPINVIAELTHDVMNTEELTYGRFLRSAYVDLDDLSDAK